VTTKDDQARRQRYDQRRRVSKPWRALYDTARWKRAREAQLAREPLCRRCTRDGKVKAATVVHHVERHDGNPALFFGSPLESLCKWHHDAEAQQTEALGYSTTIGSDGWPTDPRHPVNER
jgi:hypothetical protein